ncbi:MAG: BrnT family toxin [Colwellia sp.]|nr:BrnT family toxin [Colwellia sp.]
MKEFDWNPIKNRQLIEERGISFEGVVFYLQNGFLVDDVAHPNKEKYPNQRIFVIDIDEYIHLVPYVETDSDIFLKTVIPSRKATKQYLGGKP